MHALLSDRAGGEQRGDIIYASTYVYYPLYLIQLWILTDRNMACSLWQFEMICSKSSKCSLNGTEMKKTALRSIWSDQDSNSHLMYTKLGNTA